MVLTMTAGRELMLPTGRRLSGDRREVVVGRAPRHPDEPEVVPAHSRYLSISGAILTQLCDRMVSACVADLPARQAATSPSPVERTQRTFRFLRWYVGGVSKLVQKSSTCFEPAVAPVDAAFLTSRFAAAVACPRDLPSAELAPESHMLMKGFFLVQGFFILIYLCRSG